MSRIKDGLLRQQITLREQSMRPARLTGQMTIDGSFRLTVAVGDVAHHVDLSPQQTVDMARGMLRAMGIDVNFAGPPGCG